MNKNTWVVRSLNQISVRSSLVDNWAVWALAYRKNVFPKKIFKKEVK